MALSKGLKSYFGNLGTNVLLYPLNILTGIVTARVLGPIDKGVFTFLTLTSFFISGLTSFGSYQTYRYQISSKRFTVGEIFLTSTLITIAITVISGSIVTCLWAFNFLGESAARLSAFQFAMFLVMIMLYNLNFLYNWILIGADEFGITNVGSILKAILTMANMWVLVIILKYGVNGALFSYIITTVIVISFYLFRIFKRYKPRFRLSRQVVLDGYGYSLKTWLGNITSTVSARLDQFVVGFFLGAKDLGLYSVAVQFSDFILFIPNAMDHIFFNKISGMDDFEEKKTFTERFIRVTSLFVIIAGILAMVGGYFVIPLILGPKYKGTEILFLLYAPGVILWVWPKYITKLFSASSKPEYSAYVTLINSSVFILYYPVIKYLGIYGLAGLSIMGGLIGFLASIYLYNKFVKPFKSHMLSYQMNDFDWLLNNYILRVTEKFGLKFKKS